MDDGIIRFGDFRLDARRGQLTCGDTEVRLRPKAFEVLRFLAERRGDLVSLDELLDHCWKDLIVSFQSVTNVIYNLRSVLAEHGGDPEWIRSVSRRGYRFTAPIADAPVAASSNAGAASAVAPPADAAAPAPSPPTEHEAHAGLFVGRRRELDVLDQSWQQALRRNSQVVFVSGEPGIGKTTLVRRFCTAMEQVSQVCVGRCIPQQREAEPYMPVLEALGSLPAMKEVVDAARDEAPTWLVQMPWLISRDDRIAIRNALDDNDVGPARMLREGKRLLALLSERTPLLLVLEDVHWADTATADLVRALAQGGPASPAMLVATYRSSELIVRGHPLRDTVVDLAVREPNVTLLGLDSLPRQAVVEYLDRRFGNADLSEQLAPMLESRSGGNPLFLEALSSYLCEQGRIAFHDEKWGLTSPVDELDVGLPAGLRDMVRVQLRQLSREHVRLLEAAAAAGMEFNTLEVAAGLEISPDEAEDACRDLAGQGHFIRAVDEVTWPDGSVGETYQFAHVTYQQAIRDDTPASRRRALHGRIGMRLVQAWGRAVRAISPRLARHFEAAGDVERECEYLKQSIQLAAGRYAHREMLAYMDRTLEVIRRLPESQDRDLQELGWQAERSNLIMDWRGFASGYESFAQVVELSRQQGNSFLQFLGHIGAATSATFGRFHREKARPEAEEALAIAKEGFPELLALAHVIIGCVCDAEGRTHAAVEHAEAALAAVPDALAGVPRGYDMETFTRVLLQGNLTRLGYFERGRRERALAVEGAEARCSISAKAYSFAFIACDALISCEPEVALDLAERAIANGRESGFEHFVDAGEAAREGALLMMCPDDAVDAGGLARMEAAIEKRRAMGENWYNMLLLGYLADSHRRAGNLDRARELVDDAFADAEPVYLTELWRIKGQIEAAAASTGAAASRRKRSAAAVECYEKALGLAREHGTKLFELRTLTALARLHDGKNGSRDALATAYGALEKAADNADVRAAAAMLGRP